MQKQEREENKKQVKVAAAQQKAASKSRVAAQLDSQSREDEASSLRPDLLTKRLKNESSNATEISDELSTAFVGSDEDEDERKLEEEFQEKMEQLRKKKV